MLSKYWTIKRIKDYLRVFINELAPDKIQELALDEIIFLNLSDLVEMLNGASAPDYGVVTNVNPINSRLANSVDIKTGTFNSGAGTITRNNHGLNNSSIGRHILIWGTDRFNPARQVYFYSEISEIINDNVFKIYPTNNSITDDQIYYLVFGKYSDTYVDLSTLAYGVDKIIKLVDSINGLCIPVGDFEFQGLSNNTLKQNNVFYNHFGDRLLLYKGTNVATLGSLTLYYYRQPLRWSNDNDYIDLKDKYINLLVAKCKNSIYEFLKLAPPEGLSQYIEQKTQAIRQITLEEQQLLNMRSNKTPLS